MVLRRLYNMFKLKKSQAFLWLVSISSLLFFSACQKNHKRIYNPLKKKQTAYKDAINEYSVILPLLKTIDNPATKQLFKEHIMLRNDAYNKQKNSFFNSCKDLPYAQYKQKLDRRIGQIKRYAHKLSRKANNAYNTLEKDLQTLIAQLEHLNEVIVTAEEYRQEKLKLSERGGFGPFGILKFGLGTIIRKLIFV